MSAEILSLRPKKDSLWEPVRDTKERTVSGLVRNKASGIIYIRKQFRKLGIPPIFRSTGETTLGRAKTQSQLIIQQHVNQHLGVDDSHVLLKKKEKTFSDVGREVLSDYTPRQRKGTQVNHQIYINELIESFGRYDVNSITVKLFEDWIRRQRKSKKRRTFMDYAKHMNLVMRYAYNQKYSTHLIRFSNPDQSNFKAGRVFSKEEIERLWDVMNTETRAQFALCYECMMRLREALYLTWDRVDLESGVITLRAIDVKTGTKTGKGRQFVASPNALNLLRARYATRNRKSPFVFPSPDNPLRPVHSNKTAWKLAKTQARIKGRARWHDLRHSALSRALLESKSDPVKVSEYAGVSLRTIQAVYLHSTAEHTKSVSGAVNILV